jgi:DNA modification methylase
MRQLKLFEYESPREKLPTNLTTNRHPIHRWFNFIAGFSPEFVTWCIKEANLNASDILIDPFSGLSTSLVQANIQGLSSVGFEAHPFFYDISLAKLFPPTDINQVDEIAKICQFVEPYTSDITEIWADDAKIFLEKLIPESELRLLASALLLEKEIASTERYLYRLIISRVLEFTSGSQTDGIYKAPTSKKKSIPYQIAFQKVCDDIRDDIELLGNKIHKQAKLNFMSSENMTTLEDESCSLCVTSPPYLNNFDFAEMTRMQLYFWRYAGSWREITEKVRRRLIINTTTVPSDLKRNQSLFSETLSVDFRSHLQPIVDELLQQRQVKNGKKDYYLLVYPYFAQMQQVLRELKRVLRPQSNTHIVVADAALYGVHIQTEKLLSLLMQENGFEILNVETLRTRGSRWVLEKRKGIDKPLGEFHIYARRI